MENGAFAVLEQMLHFQYFQIQHIRRYYEVKGSGFRIFNLFNAYFPPNLVAADLHLI